MRARVRLFGEPVHPALVHVPIALLALAPLTDALGVWGDAAFWWPMSFWAIAAGLAVAALAAVVGFLDFTALPEGHPAVPTAKRHMVANVSAVGVFAVRLVLQGDAAAPEGSPLVLLGLSVVGALLLLVGGWLGGRLVFHHGVGVTAGP